MDGPFFARIFYERVCCKRAICIKVIEQTLAEFKWKKKMVLPVKMPITTSNYARLATPPRTQIKL